MMYDTIADRPRNWLTARSKFLRDLLECPYCSGFWCSAATLAVWLSFAGWSVGSNQATTVLLHGVELFAVAGVQIVGSQVDTLLHNLSEAYAQPGPHEADTRG